jgi:hypothetical protein
VCLYQMSADLAGVVIANWLYRQTQVSMDAHAAFVSCPKLRIRLSAVGFHQQNPRISHQYWLAFRFGMGSGGLGFGHLRSMAASDRVVGSSYILRTDLDLTGEMTGPHSI